MNTSSNIKVEPFFRAAYLCFVSITLECEKLGEINIISSITNKGEKRYNIARVVKSSYFYSNNIINHYCSLVTLIHEKIDLI